jgi:hypothetical protein
VSKIQSIRLNLDRSHCTFDFDKNRTNHMHQAFPVDESFDSATGVVETAEQYLKSVRDQRRAVPATVSAKVPDAYKTAADARRSIDPAWSAAIAHQQRTSDGGDERMTRWMPWLGDQWCRWRSAACEPSEDDVDLDGARDYFEFLYPATEAIISSANNDAVDENAECISVEIEGCDLDVTLDDENKTECAVDIWERIAAMTQPQLLRTFELHQSWIALPSHLTPQHVITYLNYTDAYF